MNKKVGVLLFFVVIITISVLVYINNRPFAKYVKTEKTDLEMEGYKGNVKEIIEFDDEGSYVKVKKYNKYGFETYTGAKFDTGITLSYKTKYNKWGKKSTVERRDSEEHTVVNYSYDKYGNITEISEDVKELYKRDLGKSIGKTLKYKYENSYDSESRLICAKQFNSNGDCMIETFYDPFGRKHKMEIFIIDGEETHENCLFDYEGGYLKFKTYVLLTMSPEYPNYYMRTTYNSDGSIAEYAEFWGDKLLEVCETYEYDNNGLLMKKIEKVSRRRDNDNLFDKYNLDQCDMLTKVTRYDRNQNGMKVTCSLCYPDEIDGCEIIPLNEECFEFDKMGNVTCHKYGESSCVHYIIKYYE